MPFHTPPGVMGPQARGPQQGALAPSRPQQEREVRKPNFLDRILGLYGADPATHIPDEQRKGALGQGLREAGIATLLAGGRGHESLTLGQTAGTIMGTLRGTGARIGAANTKAQQQAQMQAMVDSGDLGIDQLKAIQMQMLANGDNEGAKTVGAVLQQLIAAEKGQQFIKSKDPIYDTRKGEWIYPDTKASMKPDSWQDLGNVKVPVFGVTPDWEHALMKGRNPNSDLRRADSNIKWVISAYDKAIKAVEPSYRLTKTALKAARDGDVEKDGAVQLALLYGFIRALDPNSVVREGEVRLANEAKNLRDLAISYYRFFAEGDYSKIMSPEQIRGIMDIMSRLEKENAAWLQGQQVYYGQTIGSQLGVPPNMLRDPTVMFQSSEAGGADISYEPITGSSDADYANMGQNAAERRRLLDEDINRQPATNPFTEELGEWEGLTPEGQ